MAIQCRRKFPRSPVQHYVSMHIGGLILRQGLDPEVVDPDGAAPGVAEDVIDAPVLDLLAGDELDFRPVVRAGDAGMVDVALGVEACEAGSVECEKSDEAKCKTCAQACRKCADVCRNV